MEFVIYNAMVLYYSGTCRILGMPSGKCVDTTELPVRLSMAFGSQMQSKAVQPSPTHALVLYYSGIGRILCQAAMC